MMVRPINENDFDRRFPKGFGRSQTTKTAADNHHARHLRPRLIRAISRIDIRIVHPLFSQAFEPRNFREFWLFSPAARQWPNHFDDRQPRSLSEPETDQQNQDQRGHSEIWNHDDFDPYFANGRNVVVYIRIAVKESVTVAKDISAE